MLSGRPVMKLSTHRTWCPSARNCSQRCDPMNPAPPVMSVRTIRPRLERHPEKGDTSKSPLTRFLAALRFSTTHVACSPRLAPSSQGCQGWQPCVIWQPCPPHCPPRDTATSSLLSRTKTIPPAMAGWAQVGPQALDRASSLYSFGSGATRRRSPVVSSCMSRLPSPRRNRAAWYLPIFGLFHSSLPVAASTHRRVTAGLVRDATPLTKNRCPLPSPTGVEK